MRSRVVRLAAGAAAAGALALLVACGSSPTGPGGVNPPPGGGGVTPPPNNQPAIQSITIRGSRPNAPAGFADLGEAVQITADVRDDETNVAQLQFNWSAPVGTFSGSGAQVTWQAPAQASTPATVAIRLEVVERYGTGNTFEHRVTRTADLSLHDSIKEVGDMARQFLLDFSDSNIRDVDVVMRNFGSASTCPDFREVEGERSDVSNNRTNFRIVDYRIGAAAVTVNFGGSCPFRFKRGDACAVVPSYWDSIDLRTNARGSIDGDDIVAASYSAADNRWWLCASDYRAKSSLGASLTGFIR